MWVYQINAKEERQQTKVTEGFYELLMDWAKNRK
jgi:hypothetical protein